MDAIEAIFGRRSIRKYTSQAIGRDIIEILLRAAMSAPSAGNEQPWQFVVIDDRTLLDSIPNVHPHSQMLKEASLAILICGDLHLEKHKGNWVQDCSAATENLLIAAHAMGLGAVWLGVYPREDRVEGIRKMLHLPNHVIPLCVVSIGHPGEEKPPGNRYDPSRVRFNKW